VEGKDTAAALEGLHAREPGNPEPLLKLAGKYQERQDREKALALSQKALALDPKGTRMMRRENGEVVSFKEMAEYQYARTFMVTFGLMDHKHLRNFIENILQARWFGTLISTCCGLFLPMRKAKNSMER
jgi:hypothetical protein